MKPLHRPCFFWLLFFAAVVARGAMTPNLVDNVERPLRYTPDGTDFVIVNGPEFFNRPIYVAHSAFRLDGGDKPQFSLYLPGHGGNLRLGFVTAHGAKWLDDAAWVESRYRPGSLVYAIKDPLLGDSAVIHIVALPMPNIQGVILRATVEGSKNPVTFVWAFGGANGQRDSRNGDIGTESQPVSRYFQLQPENCRGNAFNIGVQNFSLLSGNNAIYGLTPPGSNLTLADARYWNNLSDLLASTKTTTNLPVITGQTRLSPDAPVYLAFEHGTQSGPGPGDEFTYAKMPQLFDAAEQARAQLAGRVAVDTPDPFINAAAAAINVAADAIWNDVDGYFYHGAVAWRSRYLGWRGPYSGDELGWHDRAVRHFEFWSARQNASPIGPVPPPDVAEGFARDEPAIHSNGDMENSHYDMNAVYIDALFRHLLWTGDLDFARSYWPVIERHLDWEQRLFRRPYGTGKDMLPLYEGYADIWASDDLEYGGGGSAQATAYNYFHNLMAARVAKLIGRDPTPYETEAALIKKGMDRELWLQPEGVMAEFRDLVGNKLAHASPAVWTFYHMVDSQAVSPFQAWQMSRYVDTQIAHLPLRGPGVPEGNWFTLSTTNWMPYTWSLNNVVMAESAHTALAYWQAGRDDQAYSLFKGCLLDSMYMGLCPGNAGMCTPFDDARRESQRDFADAVGMTSRAIIEGLFGVHPDALAGVLTIRPGFPASWDHASLHHPDFDFSFQDLGMDKKHTMVTTTTPPPFARMPPQRVTRDVVSETLNEKYVVESRFPKPMALRLQIPARRDQVADVKVNGKPASCRVLEDAIGKPLVEITADAATHFEVTVAWEGKTPAMLSTPEIVPLGGKLAIKLGDAKLLQFSDDQGVLNAFKIDPDVLGATAVGAPGNYTLFVRLVQGQLRWWEAVPFEIRAPMEIISPGPQDAGHLRFAVRNNTATPLDADAEIKSGSSTLKTHVKAAAFGETSEIALDAAGVSPGLNAVSVKFPNGSTITGGVTNWKIAADQAKANFETVDLAKVFNAQTTEIFERNKYMSPRSTYASLIIPASGYGNWTQPNALFYVDDSGLRAASAQGGGRITLPSGVPFATPSGDVEKNIAFTSVWQNYPQEAVVPLTGRASHIYLLMAGSTNPMQSRFDNGEVVATYADGTQSVLTLRNPVNWWPIDQDYFIDDYAFRRPEPIPPRVDLMTGRVRVMDEATAKGRGGVIPGGAATVLDMPLDPNKQLRTLTVRTLANEVVIGLMAVTLER